MAGVVDSEIADWLIAHPAPYVDYRDVAAVRELYDSYMSESGGPAPRWPRDDVELSMVRVGGIDALMWRPMGVVDPLPVVLAFHGGAFIVGGPLGAERLAAPLAAERGICTVSIAYRLAPEHPAPAALDDARRALDGLGEIPGVDPSRVAVHGSSAGACIAAGLALHARDQGRPVALQSLTCPALESQASETTDPTHSMHGLSPTLRRDDARAMWDHYLGGQSTHLASLRYAIPALADDLSGVAPAHITVAEHDVLRDEALAYASRMQEAGVPAVVELYEGAVHGFDGLLPDSDIARKALAHQVDAIALALARVSG